MIGMPRSMMQEAAQPLGPAIKRTESKPSAEPDADSFGESFARKTWPRHLVHVDARGVEHYYNVAGEIMHIYPAPPKPAAVEPRPSVDEWKAKHARRVENDADNLRPLWLMREAARQEAPKPSADGWIKWEGGECPVDGATLVDLRLRNGTIYMSRRAGHLRWLDLRTGGDMVAYRVVG